MERGLFAIFLKSIAEIFLESLLIGAMVLCDKINEAIKTLDENGKLLELILCEFLVVKLCHHVPIKPIVILHCCNCNQIFLAVNFCSVYVAII